MKMILKAAPVAAAVALCFAPLAAQATNGYFAHGYGTKNKGLVGTGVANPQSAMAAATNPAGMVMVGERLDVGAAVFSPSPRSYTASATAAPPDGTFCGASCPFTIGGPNNEQSIESENDFFLIPHFGYNWMLGTDQSVGITIYGNGGMNTEYQGGVAQHNDGTGTLVTTPGTYGAGQAGVNLEQVFLTGTYARKFAQGKAAWGASAIVAYQRFKAEGLGTFAGFSTDPSNLTDNGHDTSTGYGFKLGIQGEVAPGVTLGASYQSEMDMDEFSDYAGLFAENGDFDIPATWTIGLAWQTTKTSKLMFDVQQILYSDVSSIANPISPLLTSCTPGPTGGTGAGCLGGTGGAGFGWDDMTVYKLGYQWQTSPQWTWRAGVSIGDQPIPESEGAFNILAPAVIEEHVTFGFTRELSANSELNFAFMYAPENELEATHPFNPGQNITLEMQQYEVELSYGLRF